MPVIVSGTEYIKLPVGTTAQRPATPANGMMRVNTTTNSIEVYYSGTWVVCSTL
jgi:hypothetical protein